MAPVYRHGECIGWGATCGRHRDGLARLQCKKQLAFSGFSAEELKGKLKKWLLAGLDIDRDGAHSRTTHMLVNPRDLLLEADEDLDALLVARLAAGE